jgi:hypothetical protein
LRNSSAHGSVLRLPAQKFENVIVSCIRRRGGHGEDGVPVGQCESGRRATSHAGLTGKPLCEVCRRSRSGRQVRCQCRTRHRYDCGDADSCSKLMFHDALQASADFVVLLPAGSVRQLSKLTGSRASTPQLPSCVRSHSPWTARESSAARRRYGNDALHRRGGVPGHRSAGDQRFPIKPMSAARSLSKSCRPQYRVERSDAMSYWEQRGRFEAV